MDENCPFTSMICLLHYSSLFYDPWFSSSQIATVVTVVITSGGNAMPMRICLGGSTGWPAMARTEPGRSWSGIWWQQLQDAMGADPRSGSWECFREVLGFYQKPVIECHIYIYIYIYIYANALATGSCSIGFWVLPAPRRCDGSRINSKTYQRR